MIGVAISTTGDLHRLEFLQACLSHWCEAAPEAHIVVTVDGDGLAAEHVYRFLHHWQNIYQVGQGREHRESRQGVAVNKNTGIELLMAQGCKELFLSDDDTWPLNSGAVELHRQSELDHSMVCWGRSRKIGVSGNPPNQVAHWSWPRGAMLYVRRHVIDTVGGMDERFGPGGHEHVEWSKRIHYAGFTPFEYPTPAQYADVTGMSARHYWNAEDMQKPGEPLGSTRVRRKKITSVRRLDGDWERIEKIMADRAASSEFVPYTAAQNQRLSATLCTNMGTNLSAEEPRA
jgi:hypothetical protein